MGVYRDEEGGGKGEKGMEKLTRKKSELSLYIQSNMSEAQIIKC